MIIGLFFELVHFEQDPGIAPLSFWSCTVHDDSLLDVQYYTMWFESVSKPGIAKSNAVESMSTNNNVWV